MKQKLIILAISTLLLHPIKVIADNDRVVAVTPPGVYPVKNGYAITPYGAYPVKKVRKRRKKSMSSQDVRFLGDKRGQDYLDEESHSNQEIDQSSSLDYQMDSSDNPKRSSEPLPPHIQTIEGDNSASVSSGEKGPASGDRGTGIVVYGSDGTQRIVQPNQAKKTFEDGTVVYGLDKQ